MKRGIVAISSLVAVLAVGKLWLAENRSLSDDERFFFSTLDTAIVSDPPDAIDIIAAFGLPEACRRKTCFLESGKIADITFDGGNLRQPKEGLIFVLDGLGGSCIRTDQVREYYDTNLPEELCSHGGCWATHAQYSWGKLYFGLDTARSSCVSSLAINALPFSRPRR